MGDLADTIGPLTTGCIIWATLILPSKTLDHEVKTQQAWQRSGKVYVE